MFFFRCICIFINRFQWKHNQSCGYPETDIPIAVTNIHPANDVCDAVNEEYFHGYTPVGQPDIGYDGRTIAFVAQADVTIGETYHIKLSVADASDTLLDSAVFLEAGSFDLGLYLGDDILVSSGESECEGNPVILDTQIDESNENISFVWTYEGAVLVMKIHPHYQFLNLEIMVWLQHYLKIVFYQMRYM